MQQEMDGARHRCYNTSSCSLTRNISPVNGRGLNSCFFFRRRRLVSLFWPFECSDEPGSLESRTLDEQGLLLSGTFDEPGLLLSGYWDELRLAGSEPLVHLFLSKSKTQTKPLRKNSIGGDKTGCHLIKSLAFCKKRSKTAFELGQSLQLVDFYRSAQFFGLLKGS